MTKIAILKKRIIREYNKKENWEYSKLKGYPENTYFGYDSLASLLNGTLRDYKAYYGKRLRGWRYS